MLQCPGPEHGVSLSTTTVSAGGHGSTKQQMGVVAETLVCPIQEGRGLRNGEVGRVRHMVAAGDSFHRRIAELASGSRRPDVSVECADRTFQNSAQRGDAPAQEAVFGASTLSGVRTGWC